jgi:hypothetical protein
MQIKAQAGGGGLGGGSGTLPCAGGYMDQPAALMDAFLLLDGMVSKREVE